MAKYHAESNLWDEVAPFPLGWRYGNCIVAKDNFIYFLGGSSREDGKLLAKAGRYDLRTNKWVKIADKRMSHLIRPVLAKPRLILDEMCRLYGKFASYFSSYKWP